MWVPQLTYRIKKIRENPTQHLEGKGNLKDAATGGSPARAQPSSSKGEGLPDAFGWKGETVESKDVAVAAVAGAQY